MFGLAALLRPDIALAALILLFGAYALVDGVFAIVGVFGGTRSGTPRWLLLLEGVVGILAGIIAFVNPGLTAIALLYLVAAWAVVAGVAQIATAIRLRQEMTGEWALILGGIGEHVELVELQPLWCRLTGGGRPILEQSARSLALVAPVGHRKIVRIG